MADKYDVLNVLERMLNTRMVTCGDEHDTWYGCYMNKHILLEGAYNHQYETYTFFIHFLESREYSCQDVIEYFDKLSTLKTIIETFKQSTLDRMLYNQWTDFKVPTD